MKTVMMTRFGSPDVLEIREVEKPTPKANEVLVRVYASSVGYGDLAARNFANISPGEFNMPFPFWLMSRIVFGLRTPNKTVLGAEFAGVIEAVGETVTRFKAGDAVFGYRGLALGAHAEYLCMAEDGLLAAKPDNVSFEEAAAIPYGALTALSLLHKANLQPGQKVLVIGASGSIGSAAVQLARAMGASVTGVCGTPGLALVKELGAERVIDYTCEDFTQSGERYDLIVDILGRGSFARSKKVLQPHGNYLYASFKMKQVLQMLWTKLRGGQRVICTLSMETAADLLAIRERVEAGQLRSTVRHVYPMEQAAAAHRQAEGRHKSGSVVIRFAPEQPQAEQQPAAQRRMQAEPVY